MAEFVGDVAYSGKVLTVLAPQFRGAEIAVQPYAVKDHLPKVLAGRFTEIPVMGPDCILGASLRLVKAGIDEKDHIQDAVRVGIVYGEINVLIQGGAGFGQGLVCGGIGPYAVGYHITAIERPVPWKGDGAVNVKYRNEGAKGIVSEIIPHGPGGKAFPGEPFLIEEGVKILFRGFSLKLYVREFQKDAGHLQGIQGRPYAQDGRQYEGRYHNRAITMNVVSSFLSQALPSFI